MSVIDAHLGTPGKIPRSSILSRFAGRAMQVSWQEGGRNSVTPRGEDAIAGS